MTQTIAIRPEESIVEHVENGKREKMHISDECPFCHGKGKLLLPQIDPRILAIRTMDRNLLKRNIRRMRMQGMTYRGIARALGLKGAQSVKHYEQSKRKAL